MYMEPMPTGKPIPPELHQDDFDMGIRMHSNKYIKCLEARMFKFSVA